MLLDQDVQYAISSIVFINIGKASCFYTTRFITKWISTFCGLLNFLCIIGYENSKHFIPSLAIILFVILKVDKSKSHKASFWMTIIYMTWFRLYCFPHIYTFYLLDMLTMTVTLKLIGLGYEINNSYTDNNEQGLINPGFEDGLHYIFGIVGCSAGQYIRYRTYSDSFRMPFPRDLGIEELQRVYLRIFPLVILQRMLNLVNRNFDIYGYPLMKIIQMLLIGARTCMNILVSFAVNHLITLSFSVGGYPKECCNESGHGPTVKYDQIEELCQKEGTEYDFETISYIDMRTILTSPYFKDNIRSWNKTIQYFLFKYIYTRSFLKESKEFKAYFTCWFSAFWHGVELGNYLGLFIIWPTYSTIVDPAVKKAFNTKDKLANVTVKLLAIFLKWFIWIFSFVAISSNNVEEYFKLNGNISYAFAFLTMSMYVIIAFIK